MNRGKYAFGMQPKKRITVLMPGHEGWGIEPRERHGRIVQKNARGNRIVVLYDEWSRDNFPIHEVFYGGVSEINCGWGFPTIKAGSERVCEQEHDYPWCGAMLADPNEIEDWSEEEQGK